MRIIDYNDKLELIDIKKNKYFEIVGNTRKKIIEIITKGKKNDPIVKKIITSNIVNNIEELEKASIIEIKKNRLKSLSIEVTTLCNLKCKHCYGQFFLNYDRYIDFIFLKKLIPILNKLGTTEIALTGGEFFMHKNHQKIFNLFAKNDFKITVFTNAYSVPKIKKFLKLTKKYYFKIKVSLDGFQDSHNRLRGRNDSYKKVIEILDYIKSYNNIEVIITTILNKYNLSEINKFRDFIKNKYSYMHTIDLVFKTRYNSNSDIFFSINDLELLKAKAPYIFDKPDYNASTNPKALRCRGGVDIATLTFDKRLKICNAAVDDIFYFGNIVSVEDFYKLWVNPPTNIQFFRNEKKYHIPECKNCKLINNCLSTNCRLLANSLTGNYLKANPINCYITKNDSSKKRII